MEKLFQSVGDQVGSFRFRYVNMSTPGWTMRRQRFLVLKPFCFCNWIIHPAIKKLPVHVCLSCLSEPCTFSWPASCPPAHLVSSPVSFSYYFSNPYIFTSYLNVFQLPLTDLPLNHPRPRHRRPISFITLYFWFSSDRVPSLFTRASFHFISFDDNLSFPICLPWSPALFPQQVPFLQ